jgi:hypothetical protein
LREQREYRSRADAGVAAAQREFDLNRTNPDGATRRKVKVDLDEAKEIRALVVGGLAAAVGTAAVAKKLFQKAEQERIKKEDPLQYKKYKRGDYTE